MALTKREREICNTYQILEEFTCRDIKRCIYSGRCKCKYPTSRYNKRSGKPKIYSEKEIYLYKIRMLKNLTDWEV